MLQYNLSMFTLIHSKAKNAIFSQVESFIEEKGLTVINKDLNRPWGGFLVIAENQIDQFIRTFFSSLEFSEDEKMLRMSPKILIVAPHTRLSWQYHHRRSEIWRIIEGPVAVNLSKTDTQGKEEEFKINSIIQISQGTRHRLIGLNTWGVVAEIWKHTNPENPSDENDIVRVQDDFGR